MSDLAIRNVTFPASVINVMQLQYLAIITEKVHDSAGKWTKFAHRYPESWSRES
jgi:hypothetical protein